MFRTAVTMLASLMVVGFFAVAPASAQYRFAPAYPSTNGYYAPARTVPASYCPNGQCGIRPTVGNTCPGGICKPGACANGQCANCPNGQCGPNCVNGQCAAGCPNGQCSPRPMNCVNGVCTPATPVYRTNYAPTGAFMPQKPMHRATGYAPTKSFNTARNNPFYE